jgi:hypothetical protein
MGKKKIKDIQNRKGIVRISTELIYALALEDAGVIFKDIFILGLECDFFTEKGGTLIYKAVSIHFDEVREGEQIPHYLAEETRHKDGSLTIKWQKKIS